MAREPTWFDHGFSRINSCLGAVLALLAVTSAVPVASNRPSLWLLWTALIGSLGLCYHLLAWRMARRRPAHALPFAGFFLLAALVPAYAMLQAQDIASFVPKWMITMRAGMEPMAGGSISVVPDASMIGALRYLGYLTFLALVIEVCTRRERVRLMSRILFWGIVLQAVWALVALKILGDIALFGEKTAYLGMATGTFINRNSLATFLGFGLVLGAGMIGFRYDKPTPRTGRPLSLFEKLGAEGLLVLVAMLILFLSLMATQSRLGIASSLTGLTATILAIFWWQGRLSLWLLLAMPILLALLSAAIALGGQDIADRALFSEVDGATRLALYRQVIGMIAQRPWTGFGFDCFGPAFEAFRGPPLNGQVAFALAHDTYLTNWSEQGVIIGSVTPLLLLAATVVLIGRLRRSQDFPASAASAIGTLVLGAMHSLGDFSLEIPANNYVLLVIIGMGLARRTASGHSSNQVSAPVLAPRMAAGLPVTTGVSRVKIKDDPA